MHELIAADMNTVEQAACNTQSENSCRLYVDNTDVATLIQVHKLGDSSDTCKMTGKEDPSRVERRCKRMHS
jgi:hypothetical protein